MAYGELHLPPERPQRNTLTGRFLPGHVPYTKGKKWSDFASKHAQKRMAKGWKNLDLHRNKNGRSENCGRPRKKIIAVDDEGKWYYFSFLLSAARWCGGNRENIGRCSRNNQARRVNRWTGKVNTDHKYKGFRFYFETDLIWCEKINQSPTP